MTLQVRIDEKRFDPAVILRDLSFSVDPGEVLAVLGPSGVGKTTLLRILAGLDTAFSGEVRRPDPVSMVFQEPTLLPWRNALQNLTLAAQVGEADAEAALARVGLQGRGTQFPGQLSLGQQRRLALARAYATRPRLLLLDEPFVSLDIDLVNEMLRLTESLIAEQQPATVFVTHSVDEAARLATRILRLASAD